MKTPDWQTNFRNLPEIPKYKQWNEKLTTLDYSTFSSEEIENFKNYIFYAFNYEAILTNGLTIKNTYRLVVNENVTGKNQRITDLSYLKYPNLAIVKKTGKYNRSNSPNTTVFYSAENIDTVLKEVRPPLNKLVTVGIWKPKTQRQFISYPSLVKIILSKLTTIQRGK